MFLTLFLVGLLGGSHCVAMCGGLVGALSMAGNAHWRLHLAYNLGRIVSYATAGALVGALGAAGLLLGSDFRIFLHLLASFMLLAMGLYLLGHTLALAWLERFGQRLWRRIQPLTGNFLPVRSVWQALPLGLLWGWLPCGLVYSALTTAMASGSAVDGALCMLAFGFGTLPNLLLAGLLLARFRQFMAQIWLRRLAASAILGFAAYGFVGVWRLVH